MPANGSLPHFFGLMLGDALSIRPQIKGYGGSAPLAAVIREVMSDPGLQKAANALYVTPVVSSPAETALMIKAFRQQWEPVVRRSGFAP